MDTTHLNATYTPFFNKSFENLWHDEKGLSKSKYDSANIDGSVHTVFGVTKKYFPTEFEAILKAHNSGNEGLRDSLLKDFYWKNFWNTWYDELELFELADVCFSFGVNTNPKKAVKMVQATLNYFFDYSLVMDGKFGKNTLAAVNQMSGFWQKSLLAEYIFFINLNAFLNQFDKDTRKKFWSMLLNEPRNHNKENIKGWLNRYADVKIF